MELDKQTIVVVEYTVVVLAANSKLAVVAVDVVVVEATVVMARWVVVPTFFFCSSNPMAWLVSIDSMRKRLYCFQVVSTLMWSIVVVV